ncbi:MAG: GMP synthase [Micavibrio sp.]|nr:MAG: GMP synthase [Micavibrio sp.]
MIGSATVFRHLTNEGLGSFDGILRGAGVSLQVIDVPSEDISGIDPLEPELLIVMGGPVGVYDAPNYPFLNQEIKILEKRLEADKPTLCVCLGSQLMAKALGANVYVGEQGKEYGWHSLTLTEVGENSAVKHLGSSKTSMFHCHGDTFDLPYGTILLASTEKYENQIYSYGKNALALQCHPEVTVKQLQEWFVMFVGTITGPNAVVDIKSLREESEKFAPVMLEQNRKFLTEWLENVGNA